jgi:hypothetical protein
MKEKLRIMISSLSSQTRSLAGAVKASRLPCGRLRLALTPSRRLLSRRCLAGKKKFRFFVSPINLKSVTYVPERLLPFSPVQTVGGGWGEGDRLEHYPAISPPPQPYPIEGEGEKAFKLL